MYDYVVGSVGLAVSILSITALIATIVDVDDLIRWATKCEVRDTIVFFAVVSALWGAYGYMELDAGGELLLTSNIVMMIAMVTMYVPDGLRRIRRCKAGPVAGKTRSGRVRVGTR